MARVALHPPALAPAIPALPGAACSGHPNPDLWFPERGSGDSGREAKAICSGCPVRLPCARAGLGEDWGIWGGTTPYQRERARGRGGKRRLTRQEGTAMNGTGNGNGLPPGAERWLTLEQAAAGAGVLRATVTVMDLLRESAAAFEAGDVATCDKRFDAAWDVDSALVQIIMHRIEGGRFPHPRDAAGWATAAGLARAMLARAETAGRR